MTRRSERSRSARRALRTGPTLTPPSHRTGPPFPIPRGCGVSAPVTVPDNTRWMSHLARDSERRCPDAHRPGQGWGPLPPVLRLRRCAIARGVACHAWRAGDRHHRRPRPAGDRRHRGRAGSTSDEEPASTSRGSRGPAQGGPRVPEEGLHEMTPQRTPAEIEADLVQARAKLQSTVDDLATRLDPKTNAKKLGLAAAGVVGVIIASKVLRRTKKQH